MRANKLETAVRSMPFCLIFHVHVRVYIHCTSTMSYTCTCMLGTSLVPRPPPERPGNKASHSMHMSHHRYCLHLHVCIYMYMYMKKSGGPEQKGILWTAVSSLLALISTIYSGIHRELYTQGFPKYLWFRTNEIHPHGHKVITLGKKNPFRHKTPKPTHVYQ